MAFPTTPTVGNGRLLSRNQQDASGTRTFPDLTNLTKSPGDLLVAIVIAYQSAGSANAVFSGWGASFVELTDQMTTPGSTMAIGAATKYSTGSESGTFTVTQASPTGHASMILLAIPGAHASTLPAFNTIVNNTSAAANPGALNPANWDVEDTLWIALAGNGETSTGGAWGGIASAPANYGDFHDVTTSADTVGAVDAAIAFRALAAASEDVGTFTLDVSNARNSALVLAVRPAPLEDITDSGTVTTVVVPSQLEAVRDVGGISSASQYGYPDGDPEAKAEAGNVTSGASVSGFGHIYPSGVLDRRFDDVDDDLRCSIGQANLIGNLSIAALIRFNGTSGSLIVGHITAPSTMRLYMSRYDIGGNITRVALFTNGAAVQMSVGVIPTGQWVLVGATKAAGTATPRGHLWTPEGGWFHGDMNGTLSNAPEQNTIQFGAFASFSHYANDYAVVGEWASVLADGDFEALIADPETQNFRDLNPIALWDFGQADIGTPVADLTGNGANQSSIVGTAVDNDGPPAWAYYYPPITDSGTVTTVAALAGAETTTETGATSSLASFAGAEAAADAGNLTSVAAFAAAETRAEIGDASSVAVLDALVTTVEPVADVTTVAVIEGDGHVESPGDIFDSGTVTSVAAFAYDAMLDPLLDSGTVTSAAAFSGVEVLVVVGDGDSLASFTFVVTTLDSGSLTTVALLDGTGFADPAFDSGMVTTVALLEGSGTLGDVIFDSGVVFSVASFSAVEVELADGSLTSVASLAGVPVTLDAGALASVAVFAGVEVSTVVGSLVSAALLDALAATTDSGVFASFASISGAEAAAEPGALVTVALLDGIEAVEQIEVGDVITIALLSGVSAVTGALGLGIIVTGERAADVVGGERSDGIATGESAATITLTDRRL